jgi:NAD(P)-dependent dehydrogenase (short-subunit alcohol dehydrogenase family)
VVGGCPGSRVKVVRDGHVAIVTGGGSGIGAALCRALSERWPRRVAVLDIDGPKASAVAREVGGMALSCDVSDEEQVRRAIATVEAELGPVDLYCSNAGIALFDPSPSDPTGASNAAWNRSWGVNVMAHVHTARALVPLMLARGGGSFMLTVSAAGLLSQIGGAAYSATKHAAVAFAESLAIAHGDKGLRVSILCPQAVDTPLLRSLGSGPQAIDGVMNADAVAACALAGLADSRFLILPHPEVATYMSRKVSDHQRWLTGMQRLRRKYDDCEPDA